MKRVSTTLFITISIVGIILSVMTTTSTLGLFPKSGGDARDSRIALCEVVALHCSQGVQRRDLQMVKDGLKLTVERNGELLAARLQRSDGREVAVAGQESLFADAGEFDCASIPLFSGDKLWGELELVFRHQPTGVSIFSLEFMRFLIIFGGLAGMATHTYLRRVLQHLDPSAVVPDRVKTTLDTLAEGLVVLDTDGKIVLANQSFGRTVAVLADELQGRSLDDFDWRQTDGIRLPWTDSIHEHRVVANHVLELDIPNQKPRKFRVTCSPISSSNDECQGALVSFDDVTMLEARTSELQNMLEKLKESRDKISEQNQQLTILATRDPLTGAYNRRSLYEEMNDHWELQPATPIGCIMVDIDHFKSINDGHGHAMGDFVLRETVKIFRASVGPEDVVGRYGGEEFCIMLPQASLEKTLELAARIRASMEAHDFNGLSVTASFGVSERTADTTSVDELIDLADRSLYVAKRTGRNQVTSYLELARHEELAAQEAKETPRVLTEHDDVVISFQTVSALTAALAYRDVDTAQHSRRVANLCFEMANGLMSVKDAYILEHAAVLHDIGKIGVPDSILLKPGPLSHREWDIMKTHDSIGVEIIKSTFACDELTEIVEHHHTRYGGASDALDRPQGDDIPLGARILTIADSYDAMVSDRVYRKGLTQAAAIAELRRCAGRQFDPILVERFIDMLERQNAGDKRPFTAEEAIEKQAALRLGSQMEDLAEAVDDQDLDRIVQLAERIAETADNYEVERICLAARELAFQAKEEPDLVECLRMTLELMELCRQTQASHLTLSIEHGPRRVPGPNLGRRASDAPRLSKKATDDPANTVASSAS